MADPLRRLVLRFRFSAIEIQYGKQSSNLQFQSLYVRLLSQHPSMDLDEFTLTWVDAFFARRTFPSSIKFV